MWNFCTGTIPKSTSEYLSIAFSGDVPVSRNIYRQNSAFPSTFPATFQPIGEENFNQQANQERVC